MSSLEPPGFVRVVCNVVQESAISSWCPRPLGEILDVRPHLYRSLELWLRAPSSDPWFGRARTRKEQRIAEKTLASGMEDLLELALEEHRHSKDWRRRLRQAAGGLVFEALELSADQARVVLSDAFFQSTAEYVERVRREFSTLTSMELSQALRNVWVMLFAQEVLGRPIVLTHAIYAYSTLYPVTDNVLDDPEMSLEEKRQIGSWFRERLQGAEIDPDCTHHRDLDRLVQQIERDWPRSRFPALHGSLLAIHEAQMQSLEQQDLDASDLLNLSFRKGGASVLADGYLIAGDLSSTMADFFFGYGVFLQLLDDLQDLSEDRANGHRTLFTEATQDGQLEDLTCRLVHFMDLVLERAPSSLPFALRDLVRRSCLCLIFQSVAHHQGDFSKGFRRRVEQASPWSFEFLSRMERDLSQQARHQDCGFSSLATMVSQI